MSRFINGNYGNQGNWWDSRPLLSFSEGIERQMHSSAIYNSIASKNPPAVRSYRNLTEITVYNYLALKNPIAASSSSLYPLGP
jgi:hypothetical protein